MCSLKYKTPMLYCLLPLHHLPCQFSTSVPQPGWRNSPAVSPGRLQPIHGIRCGTGCSHSEKPFVFPQFSASFCTSETQHGACPATMITVFCASAPKVPLPIPIIREEGEQKATGSGIRHSGFAFRLCKSLPVWLWKSSWACLCCSFLTYKMGVMMLLSGIVRIKSRILE